jgi:hypothetical protein
MTTEIEQIVDGRMGTQKSLCLTGRPGCYLLQEKNHYS